MDTLIVGNEDCSYLDVSDCLVNGHTLSILHKKLMDFARQLGVGSEFLITLERRLNLELATFHGAVYEILEHWRGRKSSEATLENLVLALRKLELNDVADRLLDRFLKIQFPSPQVQALNPHNSSVQPTSHQNENQNLLDPSIQSPSRQNESQNLSNPSVQLPNIRNENQYFPNTLNELISPPNENQNLRFVREVGEITYNTSKKLGDGINTFVYRGKFGGLEVAVKKITYGDEENLNKQIKEAEILRNCSGHPNIIRFYKFEKDDNFTYLAVELCDGTLGGWLDCEIDSIPKSAISSVNLLHQATSGLSHLCKMKVVHRDLKPENILLRAVNGGVVVKIADFGISRTLPQNRSKLTVKTGTGTFGWKAPEILRAKNNKIVSRMSTATDIFSLGCIYYYVLADKKHPFGDDEDDWENNIRKYQKQIDERNIPHFLVANLKLIEAMIAEDPSDRPTTDQILCNSIFLSH